MTKICESCGQPEEKTGQPWLIVEYPDKHYRQPVGVTGLSRPYSMLVTCDDGSMWQYDPTNGESEELPPIPGTKRAAELEETDG